MFLQVCPVCEHRNPRGSRFCNECGSPLQLRFCPACHAAEDVMALACRACGEKLPLVAVADTAQSELTVPAAPDNIWKADAIEPLSIFRLPDDDPVTVHGGASPAPPVEEELPAPAPDPESESEPAWRVEPVIAKLNLTGRTMIERLQSTQPEIALRTVPVVPAEAPREPAPTPVELTPESESEIEVSAEAETLVEASFAPLATESPEVSVGEESAPVEGIGTQLRESAWRSAMAAADTSAVTPLAPAVIHRPIPAVRKLSLHRVGLLVVAAVGVLGAAVYSTRLSPGGTPPTQAAAQPSAPAPAAAPAPAPVTATAAAPAAATEPVPGTTSAAAPVAPAATPALRPADAVPAATGVAAATPAETVAHTAEPLPATPAAADRTQEKKDSAEQPAPAVRPAARRAPAATVAPAETFVPVPAQARRVPAEPVRPCTEAIAALGLCTLESRQEEN